MSSVTVTVATFNAWGMHEPWRYTLHRRITRGAAWGSPATTLRPADGVWPRRRRLLATALAGAGADIVALQEVCDLAPAGVAADQAGQLAQDLGLHHCFAPQQGEWYTGITYPTGLAVLSRYPLRRQALVPLPQPGAPGERGGSPAALHAVLDTPAGGVDLLVVHLTPRSAAAQLAGVEALLAYLDTLPSGGTPLVVGDFNASPDTPAIARMRGALRDTWGVVHGEAVGATMPSHAPVVRLDYLFVGAGPVLGQTTLLGDEPDGEGFYPSDHLGVAAVLRWPAPGAA
jgi:endonuclease/exonuclease/phosphatase family metal-dependent hydrolase